jgi:sigma-B regulation protein RsbU (phosphoserine phosphatase)
MRLLADLRRFWHELDRVGRIFAISATIWLIVSWIPELSVLRTIASVPMVVTGAIVGFRGIRHAIRHSIWRLRNRLLVAYLFVALVPVLLIATLVAVATWAMAGQTAVYLVTSEFDRRLDFLRIASGNLLQTPPQNQATGLRRLATFLEERHPGLEVLVTGQAEQRYPDTSSLALPPDQFSGAVGVVERGGEFFGWANMSGKSGRAVLVFPLSRSFLSQLVPGLGEVSIVTFDSETEGGRTKMRPRSAIRKTAQTANLVRIPEALNRFDFEVIWAAPIQVAHWDEPGNRSPALFTVRSRVSAVLKVLFSQKAEWDNSWALILISTIAILFLLVEVGALVIGVSLSRSITNAVHNLYEGTERVMEGDFTHRIQTKGRDQLAALGHSFNRMTENVERLLQVAKEKERYEAELSIAREIQAQLYPSSVPASPSLNLTALYKPARDVSGDYYDYRRIGPSRIAIAIGDVAGKGISAALLMATIQSAFRAKMHAIAGDAVVSTSEIVGQLNQHLHASTPPEKFATFLLGVFDEENCLLTYTNAGHLQPILVRGGLAQRLEVDGMVIGAFPFSRYGTSTIELQSGDLLVLFTDGISEPENEYGEMFGEDQLTDLAVKLADRPDTEVAASIIQAVEKWTGSPELQDDMTLLIVRCTGGPRTT